MEDQAAHQTFILVSSLAPHTALTNIMKVEIMSVSSSNSYHPSDAQLQIDEDSDHATRELSGDVSRKSTTLLPLAVLSPYTLQCQSHI